MVMVSCVWNECIAGRGSDEIASCLLRYFTELRSTSTKLVCYSDSCFGQNKNFTLICLWVRVSEEEGENRGSRGHR